MEHVCFHNVFLAIRSPITLSDSGDSGFSSTIFNELFASPELGSSVV
jgi:hypothetical protein